jgi:Zn-dependent protease
MDFSSVGQTIVIFVISLMSHEVMHGLVAYWLGDDTAKSRGRLSFNPIDHIDPLFTIAMPVGLALMGLPPFMAAKPVPVDYSRIRWGSRGMALVAAAGPITNLLLAFISIVAIVIIKPASSGAVFDWLSAAAGLNVGVAVFNLLPIPPLDGSRILYAFAPEPLRLILLKIESYGFMAIAALVIVGQSALTPILRAMSKQVYQVMFWLIHLFIK